MDEKDNENENEETRKNIKWKVKRRLEEKIREDDLKRIRESRYPESLKEFLYEEWESEEIPRCLLEKKNIKTIARFRTGNEFEGCKFWLQEEEQVCRMSKKVSEGVRHVFEECEGNNRKVKVENALREDGSGVGFLKGVDWVRKRVSDGLV